MAKKTPASGAIKVKAATIGTGNEWLDLLPKIRLFPGEDQTTYDGLHEEFMLDLSPISPYETVIAENLFTLEWEAMRHRRIRDDLIRIACRGYAAEAFMTEKGENIVFWVSPGATAFAAAALMGPDPALRAKSLKTLEEIGINAGEILANAYQAVGQSVEVHERKLAELEIRRRRLREDFDRLRKALPIPMIGDDVIDAEILDT